MYLAGSPKPSGMPAGMYILSIKEGNRPEQVTVIKR